MLPRTLVQVHRKDVRELFELLKREVSRGKAKQWRGFWRGRASVTAAAALGPYKKLRITRRSSTSTNYGKQIARKKGETETQN